MSPTFSLKRSLESCEEDNRVKVMATLRIVEIEYDDVSNEIEDFFLTDDFMRMAEEDKAELICKITDHFVLLSMDSILAKGKEGG